MTYKTIIFLLLPFFLFVCGGLGVMLVNEPAGIILEGLAVLTIFGMAYLPYLIHKRLIKELKQSIAPGESCAAEGYVAPNLAILVKNSQRPYRLVVGDELERRGKIDLEVNEIVNKLIKSKDRRHKIVYINMGTDDGEASFAPRYGFTILGQKRYAQTTLDELIANGVPVKEPSK